MLLIAGIGHLSAQTQTTATEISSLKLTDGMNTVRTPDGQSSFQFIKRGDSFSDVVFIDAHGHNIRLITKPASTNGQVPTTCKFPIPDACFGIPDSSEIGMCICKPTNLSSGEYTVTYRKAILTCRKAGGKD